MKINYSANNAMPLYKSDIKKIFQTAVKITGKPENIVVNIITVSPNQIKELNAKYRGVDSVTDVLSFPMLDDINNIEQEPEILLGGECNIGDIYINLVRVLEQAIEYGHSYKREYCFLALHGFLHLLGYDHMVKEQEQEMFKLQDQIMQEVGIKRGK